MTHLKGKLMMTLALLLTAVGGAWAQTETLLTTITPTAKEQASYSTANVATVSFSYTEGGDSEYLANWGWYGYGWIATVNAAEGYTITKCIFYDDANRTATDSEAPFVVETTEADKTPQVNGTPILADQSKGIKTIEVYGYVKPAASSGPEVAWDKDKKTGSFDMPGGNVTLEPEYYPQATLAAAPTAINDVPATTDGAIVKAGTVANIGETETAQGTLMYYVSQNALDDAALLALAADQWTADVPTAESLAEGQAYVYYYVRGNDSDTDEENFSDGDILAANALTVTLAAEPTYAVTFADGTAEPTLWTADPNAGVKKGQQVTVTYTGSKKVIGVKAEKKAAAPATVLSGALVDGAIIKVYFKYEAMNNKGDYVQGVYNAASGTFTASKGGNYWATFGSAVYKVEKSGDNIIIGAGTGDLNQNGMVWTFNTTNDTYTTTNAGAPNDIPEDFGLLSVTLNGTDITSQLTEVK